MPLHKRFAKVDLIVRGSIQTLLDDIDDSKQKWSTTYLSDLEHNCLRLWHNEARTSLKDYLIMLSGGKEEEQQVVDLKQTRIFPKIEYNRVVFYLGHLKSSYGPECPTDYNMPHNLVSLFPRVHSSWSSQSSLRCNLPAALHSWPPISSRPSTLPTLALFSLFYRCKYASRPTKNPQIWLIFCVFCSDRLSSRRTRRDPLPPKYPRLEKGPHPGGEGRLTIAGFGETQRLGAFENAIGCDLRLCMGSAHVLRSSHGRQRPQSITFASRDTWTNSFGAPHVHRRLCSRASRW